MTTLPGRRCGWQAFISRNWLDDPGIRSDRFGRWTYDLADHGVSADEVRERFDGYRERFGAEGYPADNRAWSAG